METAELRACPYFGLDYYEEKWGSWFFGRETERNKVITNLRAARLTLLHADSGVGKSSLLRAGVVWRLQTLAEEALARGRSPRYVPVVFNSWKDDPVPRLIEAIAAAIAPYLRDTPPPALPEHDLGQAIALASEAVDARLFVMLDQFEEYFLYTSQEPTPENFADELARCVIADELPANFLIAIREDAYATLGDLFKGRIPNVYGNYLAVGYLDARSAEDAIRKPILVYNEQPGVESVGIEDELVKAVLAQVKTTDEDDALESGAGGNGHNGHNGHGAQDGQIEVATPLLQLVMETVWRQEELRWTKQPAGEERMLHRSTLDELKGVERIVDTHLADALAHLDPDERQIAIELFGYLVTGSGGKIAESVPDLANRTDQSEADVGRVLFKLDKERIVRSVPAPPGHDPHRYRRYEIFHDVLAPAINRVFAAHKEERLEREKEEAAARAQAERRRASRFRAVAIGAIVLMLVAVGLGVFSLLEYNSATSSRHTAQLRQLTAESRQLAANADVTLATDPELSTLLALRAVRLKRTNEAVAALRSALPADQVLRTFRIGTAASAAMFDPVDTNTIASASKDGVVRIFNVKTGAIRRALLPRGARPGSNTADALAFKADGSEIAVGYGLGQIVVFNPTTGQQIASTGTGPSVRGLAFLGRSGDLAVASSSGAGVWLRGSHQPCCDRFTGTNDEFGIGVDPSNPMRVVVAGFTGTSVWNLAAAGHPQETKLDSHPAYAATFTPDGKRVAAARFDGQVALMTPGAPKRTVALVAGVAAAYSVAVSHDGKRIVAGYPDGSTRVWDIETRLSLSLLNNDTGAVPSAQFNRDGTEIVTASADGTVRVSYSQPRELQSEFYDLHRQGTKPPQVDDASFMPAGDRVLTVDSHGFATVMTPNGTPIAYLALGSVALESARSDRSGAAAVTTSTDGTVRFWDVTASGVRQAGGPMRTKSMPTYAEFSSDGSRVVAVTEGGTAEVFDSVSRRRVLILDPKNGFGVSSAAFSPTAPQIVTGDNNGQVEVWNATTGTKVTALGPPAAAIEDVEFSKDGSRLVTAASSGLVSIWNARTFRQLVTAIPCSAPNTASFSPSGTEVVVACSDGSARIISALTGQQLTILRAATTDEIKSARFDPTGTLVVTTFTGRGDTGGIRVWNTELANQSLPALERIAQSRLTRELTAAERRTYLVGISK